jgi:hypothetical protein
MAVTENPALVRCERQLRRAGLPLLIEGYSAAEDIFTRAMPLLVLVAFLETLGALNHEWSALANGGAMVGGIALLVMLFGLVNRLRGRRFLALPQRVGPAELTTFILLPALLPLVFGGQAGSASLTVLGNMLLVGLVWAVVGFGMFSIIRWAGERLFGQLAASLTLMVRALPLILFFGLLSFFTPEIWQIFSTVSDTRLAAAAALFVAIGLLFLSVRLPQEVSHVEDSVDLAGRPLRRVQRLNMALVILVSQVLQILLVTALVWLFFAAVGALLVEIPVVESWVGQPVETIVTLDLFGDQVIVTVELVRAALGIAAFSGLYYTVGMLVDATYREDFVKELTQQMQATFAIRAEYLRLRAGIPPPPE